MYPSTAGSQMNEAEFVKRFPTVDDYLRHHQKAGHICCACPSQTPPLPCCNEGHAKAERLRREFAEIVGERD